MYDGSPDNSGCALLYLFALFLHSRTPYSRMREQEKEAAMEAEYAIINRRALLKFWVIGIVFAVGYYIWFRSFIT